MQIIIMIVELLPVAQDLRCTPQSYKEREGKEWEEGWPIYAGTHCDRWCQRGQDMAQSLGDLSKVNKKRVKARKKHE